MCNVVTCRCGTKLRFGATAEHACHCNGGAITDAIDEGSLMPGVTSRNDAGIIREDMTAGLTILPMFQRNHYQDPETMDSWEDVVDSDPETRGLRDVRL
jgi:hypothetical protein